MSKHVAVAQQQNTSRSQQSALSVLNFQRQAVNHDETTALPQLKLDTLSGDFAEPRLGFDFSGVPAFTGMARQARPLLQTKPMIQRSPKDESSDSVPCLSYSDEESRQTSAPDESTVETGVPAHEAAPTAAPTEPITEEQVEPGETPASGLIVEDSATELGLGQMRRSELLSQLRTEVCRTVETAIAGSGRSTADCPYLDHWFGYYSRQDSTHIERAIRRYAPETSSATTARGYIPAVTQRARQSAETWARTGEITGVPEGIPIGLPRIGLMGSLLSGIGSIFFKARNGGARATDDPQAIQAQLGEGQPLEGSVRSRMESAFGMNFSRVRTHTDNTASELSNRFNARAFTVGEHVAFGAGEYQPGTLVGDALIAHELAHVLQQGGRSSSVVPMKTMDQSYNALEKDADKAAVGAVVSLWRDTKGALADIAQDAIPRLRSGLRLQRCAATRTARRTPESVAEEIRGDSLCPQFISMTARVREATVSTPRGRCRMGLGYCPTPRGTCGSSESSGATITATVETAEGCTGELAFMQNLLTSDRRRTLSDRSQECMSFMTPHRDGSIPWKGCLLSANSAGRHTFSTDDCPGIRLREELTDRPGVHMTAASVAESFKTFLLWKPTGESSRVAIANVTWAWSGSTTRQEGTDCASRWTEPRGTPTDGDGIASRDRPVASPTVREDDEWRECAGE